VKRFLLAIPLLACTVASAAAQSLPVFSSDPWTSEVEPFQDAKKAKLKGFTFGARVETWRADLDITDSSPAALESIIDDPAVLHSALFLTVSYAFELTPTVTITLFGGVGPEIISTRLDAGASSGDSTFDSHLVFEVGGQLTIQVDRLDVSAGLRLRSGNEAEVDASGTEDLTYFYFLFRIEAEVGFRLFDGFRPFAGIRYSLYNAEWENSDPSPDIDFEAEFDIPVGFFAGVEIGSGPVRGRLEASVLDAYGFLVSVGWTF
jgi:opacity protein-like surface antigen